MKFQELKEAFYPPAAKLKKLAVLTPELMAKHHQAVLNVLAAKLTTDDINEFLGSITGSDEEPEDVMFNLKLIAKRISALPDATVQIENDPDGPWVGGVLQPKELYFRYKNGLDQQGKDQIYSWRFDPTSFSVFYERSRWKCRIICGFTDTTKRFETAKEALDYLVKQHSKAHKEISKAQADYEKHKKDGTLIK